MRFIKSKREKVLSLILITLLLVIISFKLLIEPKAEKLKEIKEEQLVIDELVEKEALLLKEDSSPSNLKQVNITIDNLFKELISLENTSFKITSFKISDWEENSNLRLVNYHILIKGQLNNIEDSLKYIDSRYSNVFIECNSISRDLENLIYKLDCNLGIFIRDDKNDSQFN